MTAIDFLVNKLKSQGLLIGDPNNLIAVIEAKEMEKQQIIEAHGVKEKTKSNPGSIVTYGYNYTGEMYYNDKFLTLNK